MRRLPCLDMTVYVVGFQGVFVVVFCCVISTVSPCVIGVVFDLFLVSLYCLFFFLAYSVLSTRSWCCVDGAPVWTVGIRVLIFLPCRPCGTQNHHFPPPGEMLVPKSGGHYSDICGHMFPMSSDQPTQQSRTHGRASNTPETLAHHPHGLQRAHSKQILCARLHRRSHQVCHSRHHNINIGRHTSANS